jgi:hypothetical protein
MSEKSVRLLASRVQLLLDVPHDEPIEQCLSRLSSLQEATGMYIAACLEGPLNSKLAQLPLSSKSECNEVARFVNATLRSLGLAIYDQGTPDRPAILCTQHHRGEGRSAFCLELKRSVGAKVRTPGTVELPYLQLGPYKRHEGIERCWASRVSGNALKLGESR